MQTPWDAFETPDRVLDDTGLTPGQKRCILREWALVARTQRSEEAPHKTEPDQIQKALAKLACAESDDNSETPLVRDVMTALNEVIHVDHDLHEAMDRMRRYRVTTIPVVDGEQVVGVLAARDIRAAQSEAEAQEVSTRVGDHVHSDVAFCYADDTLATARVLMDKSGHDELLVVDPEGQMIGVMSLQQVRGALDEDNAPVSQETNRDVEERVSRTAGRAKRENVGRPPNYEDGPKIRK